ncbi:hypothetical protein TSMEX_011174 [Taenia solium]|eukprot:TsM_000757100 transcript=TsM_000757100 gene=TsM_000757100
MEDGKVQCAYHLAFFSSVHLLHYFLKPSSLHFKHQSLFRIFIHQFAIFCQDDVHLIRHLQTKALSRPMEPFTHHRTDLPSLFHSPAVLSTYFPRLLPTRSADPFHLPSRFIDPLTTSTTVGPYQMGRLLGRGNFAVVKLATHTQLNVPVAVKIINKELVGGQNLAKIARELEAMKRCYKHPNIVRLYHIMETDANIYMVMEYASRGEVFGEFDFIKSASATFAVGGHVKLGSRHEVIRSVGRAESVPARVLPAAQAHYFAIAQHDITREVRLRLSHL